MSKIPTLEGLVKAAEVPVKTEVVPVTKEPGAGDFFNAGSNLVAVFKVADGNKTEIQYAGFAPEGTDLKDINLEKVTGGETAAKIAENLLKTDASGRNITKDEGKAGGKPKRKSSKNRRKSKGGRKPKRKSSKNRK